MDKAASLDKALALALKLSLKERLQLIERVAASLVSEIEVREQSQSEQPTDENQ